MSVTSRIETITNYFKLIDKCTRDIELMISPACRDWVKVTEKHGITVTKKAIGDIEDIKRKNSQGALISRSNSENDVLSANPSSSDQGNKAPRLSTTISTKPMNPYICCFRGTGEVDASPEFLKELIKKVQYTSFYDYMFVEGKVVEVIDSHTEILHMKYKAKTCILTRFVDIVIVCHWYRKRDGTYVVMGRSIEHPNYVPQPSCYRAEVYSSGYIISPVKDDLNKSTVTYICHLDLNGILENDSVRAKFINLVQEKQPLNIYHLQTYISKRRHSY